ncbi:hypothetical protein RhiirA5_434050 [Rhizophagus irregularis]|uniref:Uncharacterized protein n=2 Tax=Rhizophagus irregularis TaxID=588596 RepID=U9SKF7_RHIID|nr:hypothetical protein GLOIN_2v1766853 [Rhizophagus irregularis DAOM 181602=DAOM 197198]PKB96907.1 hypothetical protein RhiirA5_434050 [Rhizophagus irregularis]PKY32126.1 hypothetical protein RhiirB3_450086 [Rhizophagus irregularis]POG78379.1 hypothetical protein GLOIN_2v1766853 [Rhizophagus irregularis DAOM 181602=DAOM 197198]GBC39968.1 hypothetical protein GLOIN_2v1766853 [Rhizophagus irregularis DAOM 181602=DAOM 197198]|eukprot:XP_025185245.1 hypothetical protein GLOIN_2v1766853 [Rhizophagus irregularis DAOM 181602=DAOM 197198]
MPIQWFFAFWNLKQRKKCKRFQAVVIDVLKSITKIIQNCEYRKLIVYFNTWASLDKTLNTEFNFKEFKEAELKQESE